ncbi:hypothetical protein [Buttiauxella ferragutiae]|uniref:hypothetical protein n=1 Tax=Buttiauxella ferragutiae TaxID=82989 RepID=UPI001F52F3B2|nr:hypothetical protein [Buttiauxella ferragutiae]UNK63036.1 hypothetical protein MNO13_08990 [Buttiauxella ferragutiae]
MSAPEWSGRFAATSARVCGWPPVVASWRGVAHSFALLPASVSFLSIAVAAVRGGSGGHFSFINNPQQKAYQWSAVGLRLKRSCPPGVVWLRRVVPRGEEACHSLPSRQLPLPAPVQRGHAKSNPGLAVVQHSAVPSLTGLASPYPANR